MPIRNGKINVLKLVTNMFELKLGNLLESKSEHNVHRWAVDYKNEKYINCELFFDNQLFYHGTVIMEYLNKYIRKIIIPNELRILNLVAEEIFKHQTRSQIKIGNIFIEVYLGYTGYTLVSNVSAKIEGLNFVMIDPCKIKV